MREAGKPTHQILNGHFDHAASYVHFPETGKPVFGRRYDHFGHTCYVETEYPPFFVWQGSDA
ncbi:hypothetical protein YW90_000971 [Salmonella enterica subsp. enterica]|nr:hypothetical protein [Salmonella enterica subsp. enterica serovar Onderstepoort]EDT6458266.1 hypothetical protein [Salmonella enterica subsp. enterica]